MKYMRNILKPLFILIIAFMMNSLNAQDWPNFKEFKEANALLPQVSQNEKRVVFMGNSITIGWLQTHPDFLKTNLMSIVELVGRQRLKCCCASVQM